MEKYLGKVVPITGQVVLTNKNATLIKVTPSIMKKVTFLTNLPNRIKTINAKLPNAILTEKELRKASRILNQKHTPDQFAFMDFFKLSIKEIKTGVICPECSHSPMIRKSAKWICLKCGCKSKNTHITALKDYALLIGNSITNKQAREFLHLSSSSVTFQILQSMNLRHTGTKKGRVYFFD
jgi:ribosomal protein L37AE/L43A